MRRPINFSEDNLAVQWQYVKRNLKEMGIWSDIKQKVKEIVKLTLQTIIWEEFDIKLYAKKYQRRKERIDYRNGYYKRSLLTTYGKIDNLKIPKARKVRVRFKTIDKYQRRQKEFDEMVMLSLILGLSTRKQAKFFKNFIGDCVSASTASSILNKISYLTKIYRNKPLTDNYVFLYLDAMWVNIKELNIKNRPILFALGVKEDDKKYMLSFKLAKSESEEEWLSFLNDLYRRGLKGLNLKLIISDNCKGLRGAVNFVYPYTPLQLCTIHKLRNILSKIKHKRQNRKILIKEASSIFKSSNKEEAIKRFNLFIKRWQNKEPFAVKTLKKDIEYYFAYFDFPPYLRNSLKSVNLLERVNRELRRIIRRIGYFQNQKSLDVFIYLTLKEQNLLIENNEDMPKETVSHREELVYV
jgi:putative transposase